MNLARLKQVTRVADVTIQQFPTLSDALATAIATATVMEEDPELDDQQRMDWSERKAKFQRAADELATLAT